MIQGKMVVLRLATQADLAAITKIASDSAEWLFWDGGQISLDDVFGTLLATGAGTMSRLWAAWAGTEIIGFISLCHIDPVQRSAEINYLGLRADKSSPWIAADLVKTLLNFSFSILGLHRVYGRVYGHHKALNKLYQHLQFRPEGLQKEAVFQSGKWIDMALYGMLDYEWKARTEPKEV